MFNYKRQFERYSRPFIAVVFGEQGRYEGGLYIPPSDPEQVSMQGIILQLTNDELQHGEGGTLTTKDKKILLDTDLHNLKQNQAIYIEDDKYKVQAIAPYNRYSHFTKVIAKRVSNDD